jgi:hypothetical protein
MKLKDFTSYSSHYSKDPKNFEKRIAIASTQGEVPLFENFSKIDDVLNLSKSVPLIMWGNFNLSNSGMNESFCSTVYNQKTIPSKFEITQAFNDEDFIPKKINDRSLVKKMKFPIIGVKGDTEEEFKTYGKFKKTERFFDHFKEKLVPSSRFEVLVSDDEPIHVHKKINKTPFDVDLNRWKNLEECKKICKKINSKYSPEFYIITLLESNDALYLDSITRNTRLTPPQSLKLYESAYEKYYSSQIPFWVKRKMFESHVKPYFVKKYYDSLLFKPTGTIDYKKYLDQ